MKKGVSDKAKQARKEMRTGFDIFKYNCVGFHAFFMGEKSRW
jgi:hypothetical protein